MLWLVPALAGLAVVTGCGDDEESGAPAQGAEQPAELQEVTLRTGFGLLPGTATGEIVARDKGFYEEAGLDVEILGGQGSSVNVRVAAENKADFVQADASNVALAVQKGAAIKMVGAYRQDPGNGIAAEPSIKTVQDMSGKTLGSITGDFTSRLFPVFKEAAGIPGDVEIRTTPEEAHPGILEQGRVDMIPALGWSEVPQLRVEGFEFNFFPYSEYGITPMGIGYVTSQEKLDADPDLVKRFVEASMRGHEWAFENPDEAAALVAEANPDINPEVAKAQIAVFPDFAHTEASEGKRVGWMAPEDWERTVEVLVDIGDLESPLEPTDLYENVLPEE